MSDTLWWLVFNDSKSLSSALDFDVPFAVFHRLCETYGTEAAAVQRAGVSIACCQRVPDMLPDLCVDPGS